MCIRDRLGIDLTIESIHPENNGSGLEASARDERYQVIKENLTQNELLLTAHHKDDQLETILFRIFRGTGINGLRGIAHYKDDKSHIILRPLLHYSRADLEGYAAANKIKWIEDDPCYVFHPMNAYTDGDKIVADMMQFEEAPLFPHLDGSTPDNKKAEARLNRWEIDLTSNSGSIKKDYLDDHIGEFPRLDERYSMSNYRYGIYASNHGNSPKGISFNSITRYDYQTTNKDVFTLSEHDAVGEPIFVPKSPDSDEGVGYVIALGYIGKENRSDLMIFDAENIASGPIARAKLPHRIPYGFHGNWRPGT